MTMPTINVCVPVLRRYDMLHKLLMSLRSSTVLPNVYILDNGQLGSKLTNAIERLQLPFEAVVQTPDQPLGVAASWNWFLTYVPEERLIANDDVEFAQRSIERMLASKADIAWAAGCGFSCFLIRDTCVMKLGYFDELISPGYAYYEDDDYLQRLNGRGTRTASAISDDIDAGVIHHRSSTLSASSPDEMTEHHRKFKIAQANYAKKWDIPLSEF